MLRGKRHITPESHISCRRSDVEPEDADQQAVDRAAHRRAEQQHHDDHRPAGQAGAEQLARADP
jgi:hypothetical protein